MMQRGNKRKKNAMGCAKKMKAYHAGLQRRAQMPQNGDVKPEG